MKEMAAMWGKALTALKVVKVDPKKFEEIGELVGRIISGFEESINFEEFPDPRSLYEQQSLAIKLQFTLEHLHKGAEELGQLEKRLQNFCKSIQEELNMRAKIRKDLRKKIQALCRGDDK